ncbi:MAG TPA: hypothetical protein PKJ86_00495 [Candidatus Dojkabacteria bacterium]|nr:hypothetical protein [Candidatus Dojkabacteria bacterium]
MVAFYGQRTLTADSLAIINFSIYFVALSGIITDSFTKWLTIELSSREIKERIMYLVSNFLRIVTIIDSVIIIIGIIIYITTPSLHNSLGITILILCSISGMLSGISSFFTSYFSAQGRFSIVSALTLILPITRIIFTFFILNDTNPWVVSLSYVVTAAITLLFNFVILSKISHHNFRDIVGSLSNKDNFSKNLKSSTLFIIENALIQICLGAFYILDGLILKEIISSYDYTVYTSLAYIYKFPLFLSISISIILLGQNVVEISDTNATQEYKKDNLISEISNKDNTQITKRSDKIKRTFFISLLLIFASFGSLIVIDTLFPGLILDILGYGQYYSRYLSLIMGFAWMANTTLYFIFVYFLKAYKDSYIFKMLIIFYAVSLIASIILTGNDLNKIIFYVLIIPIIYIIITSITGYFVKKKRNQ